MPYFLNDQLWIENLWFACFLEIEQCKKIHMKMPILIISEMFGTCMGISKQIKQN